MNSTGFTVIVAITLVLVIAGLALQALEMLEYGIF